MSPYLKRQAGRYRLITYYGLGLSVTEDFDRSTPVLMAYWGLPDTVRARVVDMRNGKVLMGPPVLA